VIRIPWPAGRRGCSCKSFEGNQRLASGSGTGMVEAIQRRGGASIVQGTIAKECGCETIGEGGGEGSGCMGGEEQMEGEPGGESEGLRGLQGEPLLGLPLGRGIGLFEEARCDSLKWSAWRRKRLAKSRRKQVVSVQERKGRRSSPLDQRREGASATEPCYGGRSRGKARK
jgi:hypothetical protein